LKIKTKIDSSHKADSKPVKQEINGTVMLPYGCNRQYTCHKPMRQGQPIHLASTTGGFEVPPYIIIKVIGNFLNQPQLRRFISVMSVNGTDRNKRA
jgi:hypothetical protein